MDGNKQMIGQRKHRRFKPQDGAYAVLMPNCTVGQIINISKGGLAFRYIDDGEQINGTLKMDIFISGNSFCLRAIPFKTVSDLYLDNEVPFSIITMKRCGGQFEELTHSQVFQLDYFIGSHTKGEI